MLQNRKFSGTQIAEQTMSVVLLMFSAPSAILFAEDSASRAPSLGVAVKAGSVELDPAKIVGPETCSQCHGSELQVWRSTPHFRTFEELHRKPAAKEIATKMGIRSIKRGDMCIRCHYTPQSHGSQIRPIAGVSCETCHGPARDWLKIHSDYGGATVSKDTETEEHRRQRFAESIQAGMRNPMNAYLVARSCLNCHTIPDEELVNVGGHSPTDEDFEFVSWAEGSQRHNFLRANNSGNPISSPERLRVMYIAGLMADLEYSLRATAKATAVKSYGIAVAKRAYTVRRKLADAQELLQHPMLAEALQVAYGVKLKSNNHHELEAAADRIGTVAYEFADTVDGSTLAAIDGMLPPSNTYR
jgi:Cytochrome c554 and c-prime